MYQQPLVFRDFGLRRIPPQNRCNPLLQDAAFELSTPCQAPDLDAANFRLRRKVNRQRVAIRLHPTHRGMQTMRKTRNTIDDDHTATPAPLGKPLAELLDKKSLCERLNVSPRTIENMVNAGTFPPPVRMGKYVYWSEVAVSVWQRRMFAAQEAWTPH